MSHVTHPLSRVLFDGSKAQGYMDEWVIVKRIYCTPNYSTSPNRGLSFRPLRCPLFSKGGHCQKLFSRRENPLFCYSQKVEILERCSHQGIFPFFCYSKKGDILKRCSQEGALSKGEHCLFLPFSKGRLSQKSLSKVSSLLELLCANSINGDCTYIYVMWVYIHLCDCT